MKKLACVLLALASILAGCSGGSGGSMPQATPTPPPTPAPVKLRFVNATPSTNTLTIDFVMAGVYYTLAPREASQVVSVMPGPVTVTVGDGVRSATRTLSIAANSDAYVVSSEFIAGQLDVTTQEGVSTSVPAGVAVVSYLNPTPGSSPQDFYLLPPGVTVSMTAATFPAQGGSAEGNFPPGSYSIAITPAGKKTVLFQSAPITLTAGQQLRLVGAPLARFMFTPVPLVLGLDSPLVSLGDARPLVTLLTRFDRLSPPSGTGTGVDQDASETLSVDGDLVAEMPNTSLKGISFHVSPGPHTFTSATAFASNTSAFDVDPAATYVTRFAFTPIGVAQPGAYWVAPYATPDYPSPATTTRIRLIVENNCRDNFIRVDGTPIQYADQSPGNAGIVFDRPVGPIRVEVFTPDAFSSEGVGTFNVGKGHYYVIRVFALSAFTGAPPAVCTSTALPLVPIPHFFEVSEG